jgi:hypothetical protein
MNEAKALAWVREFFPRWAHLAWKVPTIGALLNRPVGDLLRAKEGWSTFHDGLQSHLALAPRPFAALVKWLDSQPLGTLADAKQGDATGH